MEFLRELTDTELDAVSGGAAAAAATSSGDSAQAIATQGTGPSASLVTRTVGTTTVIAVAETFANGPAAGAGAGA
jgi:hypothetical protein